MTHKIVTLLTKGKDYKELEKYAENITYIMEFHKITLTKEELRESALQIARISHGVLNGSERKEFLEVIREINKLGSERELEDLREAGKNHDYPKELLNHSVILLRLNSVCLDCLDKLGGVFNILDDKFTVATPNHNSFLRGIAKGNIVTLKATIVDLKTFRYKNTPPQ